MDLEPFSVLFRCQKSAFVVIFKEKPFPFLRKTPVKATFALKITEHGSASLRKEQTENKHCYYI